MFTADGSPENWLTSTVTCNLGLPVPIPYVPRRDFTNVISPEGGGGGVGFQSLSASCASRPESEFDSYSILIKSASGGMKAT